MATLALDSPSLFDAPPAPEPERTLADVVLGAWDAVLAGAPGECPVCTGTLAPRHGAGSRPVGGACRDCGTRLG